MTIASLMQVVSPPPVPLENAGDWGLVEATFGPLPRDYVEMITAYGFGRFGNVCGKLLDISKPFIWLLSPFATNRYGNLVYQTGVVSSLKEMFVPRSLRLPRTDRLIVFGITHNGDYLCLETIGGPDSWLTLVYNARDFRIERNDMGATDFLSRALSGQYESNFYPRRFKFSSPVFVSGE
jgi:hypothetical protein